MDCEHCARADHDNCIGPPCTPAECKCSCRSDSHAAAMALAEKQSKKWSSDEFRVYLGTKKSDGMKMYPDRIEKGWWVQVPDKRDSGGWPMHNTFIPFSQYWVYYG